jgi:hypothetical protein
MFRGVAKQLVQANRLAGKNGNERAHWVNPSDPLWDTEYLRGGAIHPETERMDGTIVKKKAIPRYFSPPFLMVPFMHADNDGREDASP